MKTPSFLPLALGLILSASCHLSAQGTAFTYHGQLSQQGRPGRGEHHLRFGLFDAPTNGNQIASREITAVRVQAGEFTVTLDFGDGVFDGSPRWLEISVQTRQDQWITLHPRQHFMPTPYAIMANSASNLLGTLPASQLSGPIPASQLSGTLPATLLSGTYSSPLNLDNPANNFSGSGAGLAGVDALTLSGLGAGNFWKLGGNAGTTAGADFIGTTDNQPLELKVNGQRAMRLEPTSGGTPNVIGGAPENAVLPGIAGATISGGGQSNNVASGFGAIGGGRKQHHPNQLRILDNQRRARKPYKILSL